MHAQTHTLTPDTSFGVFNPSSGTFVLPALPFEASALVPVTGAETLHIHLGKHHQSYIDGANAILKPLTELAREILTIEAHGDYAAAKAMIEKYAVMRPELQAALGRLSAIPVDIQPSFE